MADAKAFDLTPLMIQIARDAAPKEIAPDLSEYDQLLGFFLKVPLPPSEAITAYFSGGEADAKKVAELLKQLGLMGGGKSILEFAAGYGRVTRHLKHLLSDNKFAASDIHPSACAMIKGPIGVPAYLSSTSPENLSIPGGHDFVFAMSLFSHLPITTQGRWMRQLYDLLVPGGYLMFTTHGDFAMRQQPAFFGENFNEDLGFGYRTDTDQSDLSSEDYGTAVVTMPFVYNTLREFLPGAEIKSYREAEWFALQDEWLIRKPVA